MRLNDQKPCVSHPLLGFLEDSDFCFCCRKTRSQSRPGQRGCKTPGVLASPRGERVQGATCFQGSRGISSPAALPIFRNSQFEAVGFFFFISFLLLLLLLLQEELGSRNVCKRQSTFQYICARSPSQPARESAQTPLFYFSVGVQQCYFKENACTAFSLQTLQPSFDQCNSLAWANLTSGCFAGCGELPLT